MRRNTSYLITDLLLLAVFAVAAPPVPAQGSASGPQRDSKPASCRQNVDFPQTFYDRLAGPPGRWSVAYSPEQTAAPVGITMVNGFGGRQRGKERGLAITCAALKNNSGKAVEGIKLSWVLTADGDPGAVLLRGDPPLLDVRLASGEGKEVDFDDIFFSEISRPLVKRGVLDDAYRWLFRVSEVRYEDGGVWAEAAI